MKKFLTSIALVAAVLTASAESPANYTLSSFLNPNVSFLVISNGLAGVTNLAYISQNLLQGTYQIGTNLAGTSLTAPIATNYAAPVTYYSNSTPATWFGQNFGGSFIILTNNSVAASASTNDVIYQTVNTNNQINFFQDVPIPQNFFNTMGEYGIGAASTTNSIGMLQIVTTPFSLYGYAAGAGSNIVNFAFEPVGATYPTTSASPTIGGFVPGLGSSFNTDLWTVTFTNQISTVGAPTVFVTPVPRWKFAGAKAMRLRYAYTGTSTNAVGIQSITLGTWTP